MADPVGAQLCGEVSSERRLCLYPRTGRGGGGHGHSSCPQCWLHHARAQRALAHPPCPANGPFLLRPPTPDRCAPCTAGAHARSAFALITRVRPPQSSLQSRRGRTLCLMCCTTCRQQLQRCRCRRSPRRPPRRCQHRHPRTRLWHRGPALGCREPLPAVAQERPRPMAAPLPLLLERPWPLRRLGRHA